MKVRIIILFLLAACANSFGQSRAQIDSMIDLAYSTADPVEKSNTLVVLSKIYFSFAPDSGRQFCEEALIVSRKNETSRGIGNAGAMLAIYCTMQGDFEQALVLNTEALDIYTTLGDQDRTAAILGNMGKIYREQGEPEKALEMHFRAMPIFESMGNERSLAVELASVGAIYFMQGRLEEALENYTAALELSQKMGDRRNVCFTLLNMGETCTDLGQIRTAQAHFTNAKELALELNDPWAIASCNTTIGEFHVTSGAVTMAKAELNEALEQWETLGEKFRQAETLIVLARLALKTGTAEESISYSERALVIATNLGANEMVMDIHQYLSETWEIVGNQDSALLHLKAMVLLKDSLFSEAQDATIIELQEQYNAEKKDRENADLQTLGATQQLEIESRTKWMWAAIGGGLVLLIGILLLVLRHRTRIHRQEASFMKKQNELEQQALRAQMNPHFIFNSLNAIQGMYLNGETDLAIEYMGDFSTLMRKILDNSGKESISLKEEMETLHHYVQLEKARNEDIFDYNIDLHESIDQLNTMVPPLLLQPFVENAIWHGILPKKRQGQIYVRIFPAEDQKHLICTIEDDGVGYSPTPGKSTSASQHKPKGIALTEERLGSKVTVENLDPGTRVTLLIQL